MLRCITPRVAQRLLGDDHSFLAFGITFRDSSEAGFACILGHAENFDSLNFEGY